MKRRCRTKVINIIRSAYDRGVTFLDAAEAYGPFEVERILEEGNASFHNKVVITTKFGWNIDQQTRKWRLGIRQQAGTHRCGRGRDVETA
jgi:aryl-alcohol dehydrogenase-like predicted oxidoreductase